MKNVLLVISLLLLIIPTALGAVNPTGSNDQVQINKAVATSQVVVLNAGTYKISAPIVLKSGTILKGVGDKTIIYAASGVCNSGSAEGYIVGNSVKNVEISGLQFKSAASGTKDGGHGEARNCIRLRSCTNVKIHDVLFQNFLYNDGIRDSGSNNLQIYNCRINAGHDGICFYKSKNSRAYNNNIIIRTNTGVRVYSASNTQLDHNTFSGLTNSGWCCTEMEGSLSGIKINNNIFHDYKGSAGNAAVQPYSASGSALITDNVLWNVGGIKFGSSKNNIINPQQKSVSYWIGRGYGSTLST
jgi:parallel beta-helix repeat protein